MTVHRSNGIVAWKSPEEKFCEHASVGSVLGIAHAIVITP